MPTGNVGSTLTHFYYGTHLAYIQSESWSGMPEKPYARTVTLFLDNALPRQGVMVPTMPGCPNGGDMKHRGLFVCFFSLLFFLGGCSTWRGVDEQVHFDPSGKTTFYRDSWVQRNPPEVHVQPKMAAPSGLRVLFIPFRVTQPIDNPTVLGYTTARTVWQTWLSMQIFPNMEFSGDDTPYRRDRAVALARSRGADLVIGGFVTYVYAGGTAGDSQIALQVEAHDTRSGQLVWSMAQSGMIPASRTTDYFLFATKTRMPSDPLHAITQAIASDMGTKLQDWVSGPTPMTKMEEVDRSVHDTLLPPRDPVPTPRTRYQAPEEGYPYNPEPVNSF